MTPSLLESALKLSKAERILLAERLWDSVAEEDVALDLTDAQRAELDRRLERLEAAGPQGSDWHAVRARVTRRGGAT
jgi:putative addiction module component (TIGR02574 family)